MQKMIGGFRLSPQQARVWAGGTGARARVSSCALLLTGPLDAAALRAAFGRVAGRHEILRTTFFERPGMGQPVQVVRDEAETAWQEAGLEDLDPERQLELVEAIFSAARSRAFDLEQGPPLRLVLASLSAEKHLLSVSLPLVCADARTLDNLVAETARAYGAPAADRDAEEPTQYVQFSEWRNELLEAEEAESGAAYWRRQAETAADVSLQLPCEALSADLSSDALDTVRVPLGVEPARVSALADEFKVSRAAVLLACWETLLWRLTGQTEIVVSALFDGRKFEELEGALGLFASYLPVRCEFAEGLSFADALARVDSSMREASHWEAYFDAGRGGESTTTGRPARVGFEYERRPAAVRAGGVSFEVRERHVRLEPFKLKLSCVEDAGALSAELSYARALFSNEDARRLAGQFQRMVASAVESPAAAADELEMLSEAERRQLLAEFNRAAGEYAAERKDRPLHQLFEEQAARTPESVAVVFRKERLTYGELNARANRLAHRLLRLGVGPDELVGLCVERSPEMVVGLLGILKAGAAYLPLDPAYPKDRLSFMVQDAAVKVILTQEGPADSLPAHDAATVRLDADPELLGGGDEANTLNPAPPDTFGPENLAYVIYTSGSTGTPKGVGVTHANVARLFAATDEWFNFGPADVWTLFHSYAFDFSVWELWGALLYGGRLVVVPYLVSRSPEAFYELVSRERVTVLNQTPSAFRQFCAADESVGARPEAGSAPLSLRYVIFGGEALELQSLRPWFERHGDRRPRLVNMYGITETTVHVTYRPVEAADAEDASARSLIGRPIPDLQVHVMDRRGRLAPVGVAGEMYVGGRGLARGYLNRPELSAQRFVPDPFSAEPGARLYRSGDLARRLGNGDIEYLGRIDQQVKIRGHRIELGEIEAALRRHASVRDVVVAARSEGAGDKRLVAYVVPRAGETPSPNELRQLARQTLPDYMVPAVVVLLDALPLTPSGKVDKRALPAPDAARLDARETYLAPRTTVEQVLAAVWAEVLGVEQVGVRDNYFNLGGDSIRSVRVLGLARERGLNITLQDIFNHQTVSELARAVEQAEGLAESGERSRPFGLVAEEDLGRLPQGLEDAYPLTDLQMGMLYHMEARPDAPAYHNVSSYHVRAEFDADVLREAVRRVVKRHPVLRTSFDLKSYGEPLQLVHPEAELELPVTDLRGLPREAQEAALDEYVRSEWATPFDLARPPLLRLHIHRRADDTFQLTVTECHAILDGWSLTSTFAEIFNTHYALLEDEALPHEAPPPVAFRDYVFSERRALGSDACRDYWARLLADCAPTMLPRWQRPAAARQGGRRVRLEPVALDAETGRGLARLAHQLAVPLKSVLFAAHLKVLGVLCATDDVLTGLSVNGRPEEVGGEQARGLFVKTVPFRLGVAPGSWVELIKETFRAEWEMLPHRHYPLSALQKSGGGRELFETEFHFLHFHSVEGLLRSGKLDILGNLDITETNFTLMAGCQLNPVNSELSINLHCDTEVLPDEQAAYLAELYARALRAMCDDPHARHETVNLLPAAGGPGGRQGDETAGLAVRGEGLSRGRGVGDESRPFVAARNPVEQTLAGLWSQVLGVERVGIHDHFLDLGGDSLLATQLISKVRHAFEIELPLSALLADPTVAGMAAHIEAADGEGRGGPNDLAAMLESLEQLSEQEARALLDSKLAARVSND